VALSLIAPHRGHLITRRMNSASASFLLQVQQRITFTSMPMRVGFGALCAQHGASAKRRRGLREVTTSVFPHRGSRTVLFRVDPFEISSGR
jgi:hypothetical protein